MNIKAINMSIVFADIAELTVRELVKKGYVSKYQFSNEEKNAFMMEDIVNLGNYETFSEWGLEHTRYARVSSIFKGKQ